MEKRQYESVRRPFTDKEIEEKQERLLQRIGDVRELTAEKKRITTDLGAGIKSAESEVFGLQIQLSTGYEMVDVEVVTLWDTPQHGYKRTLRVDTGETLRDEPMTPREQQQQGLFGLQEPEA